ncbi:TPA: antirestriction protein [Escherichia coli]|nr:antirestriction protein [Escherichia coli]HDQ1285269.1 antirestriction protein [Escherichia coli]
MRLASRFGYANQIRRDRPLTREELMQVVPSVFGEEKHTSRSENYTWIPTITVLESLQREGFQPFFACQTRVRDPGRRGYTKHMLRLRRDGEINGQHVPEIILLNSHDGNRAEMSPEAAGIAACLMTYSHHACRTECYAMTVHYYRLRDYALQHPECNAIMCIID